MRYKETDWGVDRYLIHEDQIGQLDGIADSVASVLDTLVEHLGEDQS